MSLGLLFVNFGLSTAFNSQVRDTHGTDGQIDGVQSVTRPLLRGSHN